MTDTPQLLLAHHLKALKLPTFLREYDKLARQCAADGLDHIRFLLRLAELELIDRERRMVERRIKEAKFPAVKSLDSKWPADSDQRPRHDGYAMQEAGLKRRSTISIPRVEPHDLASFGAASV